MGTSEFRRASSVDRAPMGSHRATVSWPARCNLRQRADQGQWRDIGELYNGHGPRTKIYALVLVSIFDKGKGRYLDRRCVREHTYM